MSKKGQVVLKIDKTKSVSSVKKGLDEDSAKMIAVLESSKPYHEKLKYVKHELEESVRIVTFNYTVVGFMEDVAYAINEAVKEVHGFSRQSDRKGASKDNPPEMVDVRFADGTRIKVPIGRIELGQFGKGAFINTYYDYEEGKMLIEGQCQKRYTVIMDNIIERVEWSVSNNSIYKNQAIKYDGYESPEFMDLSGIEGIELFLTANAKFATVPIEARIERCEECEALGIDIKFGALLEGSYGTGKTLYASKLALKAIRNDWTFIYCSKPENTLKVLEVANRFSNNGRGVVLFVEDIDKVLSVRNTMTNEISLLMDGSETKDNNIISIFSTNHIENIEPTFLRGKRIGSIVTLTHLDATTAKDMMEHYLDGKVKGDLEEASAKVEEYEIVPAFLSEIIDRVKTHALISDSKVIEEEQILAAIEQFKRQMDIAKVRVNTETPKDRLWNAQQEFLNESSFGEEMRNRYSYIEDQLSNIQDNL